MPKRAFTNPLTEIGSPFLEGMTAADVLEHAGYDFHDEQDYLFGVLALVAAVQVYNAALLPGRPGRRVPKVGRNAPCPCGSGRKYKKCCGRGSGRSGSTEPSPGRAKINPLDLIPRLGSEERTYEGLSVLKRMFQEDPGLRAARFTGSLLREFVLDAMREAGDDDRTPEFYNRIMRRYLREVEDPVVLGDLGDLMREAVPRWSGDPDALRALALGVALQMLEDAVEEDEVPESDEPNPLHWMILELTLEELTRSEEALLDWIGGAGGPEALRQRLARGEPLPLTSLPFDDAGTVLPQGKTEATEKFLGEFAREIQGGGLPVTLPLASVLPAVVRLALCQREAEPTPEQIADLIAGAADELGPEDAEVLDAALKEWLEEHADGADEATLVRIGCLRTLLAGGSFGSLEDALVFATLKSGLTMDIEGAPPLPEGEEGGGILDALTPEYLERYGDFLWEKGLPEMARRTWKLCGLFGPLSPSVEEKLSRA